VSSARLSLRTSLSLISIHRGHPIMLGESVGASYDLLWPTILRLRLSGVRSSRTCCGS
jgi:hypothetical protein